MKGIGYLILIAVAAYAAWKYWAGQTVQKATLDNRKVNPPGVSFYQPVAVTQRPQQLRTYIPWDESTHCQWTESTNPQCALPTTQFGYAPAFGPNENQNSTCGVFLP